MQQNLLFNEDLKSEMMLKRQHKIVADAENEWH